MTYRTLGTSHSPTSSSESYSSPTNPISALENQRWTYSPNPAPTPHIFSTRKSFSVASISTPRLAASEAPMTIADANRTINYHLLRSCALLAQNQPEEGLKEADFTLYMAEVREIYHLQSKSQFYRGLCLMELERWGEASTAFTKAANVRWWASRVAELKIEAERRIIEAQDGRVSSTKKRRRDISKYF